MLISLTSLGCKKVVITGVSFEGGSLGCYGYDSESGEFFSYFNPEINKHYHGTGDVFASVCFSSLVLGKSLYDSCRSAADFVCKAILATMNDDRPITYGVHFEKVLRELR